MTLWRRRRREDLRPTWEQRHAALESVRERLRKQGAEERRRTLVRRAAPAAALAAFALGTFAAAPLLRAGEAANAEVFAVRRLAIVGAERLDAAEVARAAGLAGPDAGAAIGPAEVRERLAAHPWIAGVRTARVSPDTVVVRIVERVPAAVWVRALPGASTGESSAPAEAFLVDADGTAFAPAGSAELPRLHLLAADAAPCPPDRACAPDPRLAAGVALARAVERAGFARPEIELDGISLHDPEGTPARAVPVLRLAGVAPRVLIGPGDLDAQLEELTRVLADVPASREAAEIDLRFAGQVVLRPPSPGPGEEVDEAPAEGGPRASATGARAG